MLTTTLKREWRVTIPEAVIQEIGGRDNSVWECWAECGEIRLRPAVSVGKKSG